MHINSYIAYSKYFTNTNLSKSSNATSVSAFSPFYIFYISGYPCLSSPLIAFILLTVILPLNAEFLFYLKHHKLSIGHLCFSATLLVAVAYSVAMVGPPISQYAFLCFKDRVLLCCSGKTGSLIKSPWALRNCTVHFGLFSDIL